MDAAADKEDEFCAVDVEHVGHKPRVETARRDGEGILDLAPVLLKGHVVDGVYVLLPENVREQRGLRPGADQFPDSGSGVDLRDTDKAHHLRQELHRDPMLLGPIEGCVHRPVGMDGKPEIGTVVPQGRNSRRPGDHDVDHRVVPAVIGKHLGPFLHRLRIGRDVDERGLSLAGLLLGPIAHLRHRPDAVVEPVEREGRQVLIVLDEVESAHPGLVADLGVLLCREPHLRFRDRTRERPSTDLHHIPDPLDAEMRPLEVTEILSRERDIDQAEVVKRFHPEDVPGNPA